MVFVSILYFVGKAAGMWVLMAYMGHNAFVMPKSVAVAGMPPFSTEEVELMYEYLNQNININGSGAVAAANPGKTPGGSYWFHWDRDAAVIMRTLLLTASSFASHKPRILRNLHAYVDWVMLTQHATPANGMDVRVEPKFHLPNGSLFRGSWCRPQNDGPGLKALALIDFANMLLDEGDSETVKKYLWTGNPAQQGGGAIWHNLEYVANNWGSATCDLWEDHLDFGFFWNGATMKKALLEGARFAQKMGDRKSHDQYWQAITFMDDKGWKRYWKGNGSVSEINPWWTWPWLNALEFWAHVNVYIGGILEAHGPDGSVVCAFNHAWDELTVEWSPLSIHVARTVLAYNHAFSKEYPINWWDYFHSVPGIMYGRYPNDWYAGGNPWVLTTAGLAHLLMRVAAKVQQEGVPEPEVLDVWKKAIRLNCETGACADKDKLAIQFITAGDAVLLRIRSHIKPEEKFHLYEQHEKHTGEQMAAEDLSWSYAEVLLAVHARNVFFGLTDKEARLTAEMGHRYRRSSGEL